MAKKIETVPVKTTKVKIVFEGLSSTIRRDNLPTIIDKTENAVAWLAKHYKLEEIEVVGNKPEYWAKFFPENSTNERIS